MSEHEWPPPAYVITTPRLVLRCYERDDVTAVQAVVLRNLDALRPWMPWIALEPKSDEERGEQLRRFRGRFDLGEDFIYGVFDRISGAYVGGCGLHPRVAPGAIEIGYWIREDRWGQGLATEAAAALTRVGFERMEALRVEIRVDPENTRSLRVPPKLGFSHEGTLRGVGAPRGGRHADLTVFGMLRGELETSPAARVAVTTEGFTRPD
jgi:RimJ/RimL family protein N-acetyltransferase